jgi:hypothetical protein
MTNQTILQAILEKGRSETSSAHGFMPERQKGEINN